MKYAIIRDRSIGGTEVIDVAVVGMLVSNDADFPRYNVRYIHNGKVERHAYERSINAREIGSAPEVFVALGKLGANADASHPARKAWEQMRAIAA